MVRIPLAALAGALILAACGGGGGSPPPQPQTIKFNDAGPIDKIVGNGPFANTASGGGGTGSITYASDTFAVATVDANTGTVTIAGAGTATITATKAADSQYLAASATYTLLVAPNSVGITAWVGPSDTEIAFTSLPVPVQFLRSSDLACDPTAIASCANGAQSDAGTTAVDTVATRTQPAAYWLAFGGNLTTGVGIPERKFVTQTASSSVVLNGRLWVLAQPTSEVWSSGDGLNWRLETPAGGFCSCTENKLTVFNNELWVVSLVNSSIPWFQVTKSIDGRNWTLVSQSTNIPARSAYAVAAFNGRLWLSGGASYGCGAWPYCRDVWSSSDGVTWTQATAAATPYGRSNHGMIAFGGKLWMIGGFDGGVVAEVWSSSDGATWTQVTANAAFGPRFDQGLATDGTTLWLIAGRDGYQSARNDVWSSTDGSNWTQVTAAAEFQQRATEGAVFWNGKLWVVGGNGLACCANNEVWASTTGANWVKQSLTSRMPQTTAITFTSFLGKLWALDLMMQLWSSSDGLEWTLSAPTMPTSTIDPHLLALPDRLLLIGGWQYTAPSYYREVWQSTDGATWTKASGSVPVDAGAPVQALVANGRAWLFGGNVANSTVQEVWSSSDGSQWTLAVTQPPYSPRTGYTTLWNNGKFWLVGGSNDSGGLSDVWSSADGASWAQGTSTGLPPDDFQYGFAFGGSLCVENGGAFDAPALNWCSTDGLTWTQLSNNPPLGPSATLNGALYMIGMIGVGPPGSDLVWRSTDGLAWRLGYRNSLAFP
jgi:hypothetical protein